MVEAKDTAHAQKGGLDAEAKKARKAERKKGKKERGADGKKESKHDSRVVKHIARAISGLSQTEWNALNKEGHKAHMKTAKKVLSIQQKIGAKPPKEKGSKKKGGPAGAEGGQD